MREAITAAAALGLSLTLSSAAVVAAERDNYAIESQPLASALREFARQTGIQVAAQTELTAGKRSSELIGQYAASDALLTLLRGTGLTACKVNEKTFGIRALTSGAKPESVEDCGTMRRATQLEQTSLRQETSSSAPSSGPAQEVPSELYVEEVLVTAQKRTERAQDVPVPVSVLTADSLARGNALRLQDYSARVPGLNFTPGLASQQILAIRGVSTGTGTNPTVGVMIDDVPFGSTSNIGGGNAVPDLDPSDLARIEVLRGPQGTLYGANSIGGLLKFVTLDPSTEGFSGKLQTGISHVRNGDDLGYSARASVNVPLSETFAIRASGFGRQDPGYVDDPVQGRQGVNSADVYGGQASALWRISQAWSLKLGALAQRTEGDGRADSEPLLGDLMQRRLPGSGGYDKQVQAYSATLSADLGNAQLISVSGYNKNRSSDALDAGFIYASQVQPRFGTSAAILESDFDSSRFTQEVRVSMSLSSKVEWLIGGFYTDEDRRGVQTIFAADSATGAPIGLLRSTDSPNTYEEYAAFTNVTLQLTDRFDVQLGGRYSENEQSYRQAQVGVGATVSGNQPKRTTEADAFTYLVTPRFMFSPDLMVYARVASGYRPGGPNGDPLTPPQYQPDTTRNYEVGIKGEALDRALTFDASIYYIDWEDIQLFIINPVTARGYTTNGSRARSQGVEVALESRPWKAMTAALWVAYNDAELTEDFPLGSTVRGFRGDRLPFSSRYSANLAIDQEIALSDALTAFVGASVNYMGDRKGGFTGGAGARQTLSDYTEVALRTGVTSGSWSAELSVTNLTDERGELYGGLGALPPSSFNYIRPRTVALWLGKTF